MGGWRLANGFLAAPGHGHAVWDGMGARTVLAGMALDETRNEKRETAKRLPVQCAVLLLLLLLDALRLARAGAAEALL